MSGGGKERKKKRLVRNEALRWRRSGVQKEWSPSPQGASYQARDTYVICGRSESSLKFRT